MLVLSVYSLVSGTGLVPGVLIFVVVGVFSEVQYLPTQDASLVARFTGTLTLVGLFCERM